MPSHALVLAEDVTHGPAPILLASMHRPASRARTERTASTRLHTEHAQDILYPGNSGGIEP
ncbi:MAG: hypothetical protein WC911_01760 [Thermoleophilia bacterium]